MCAYACKMSHLNEVLLITKNLLSCYRWFLTTIWLVNDEVNVFYIYENSSASVFHLELTCFSWLSRVPFLCKCQLHFFRTIMEASRAITDPHASKYKETWGFVTGKSYSDRNSLKEPRDEDDRSWVQPSHTVPPCL